MFDSGCCSRFIGCSLHSIGSIGCTLDFQCHRTSMVARSVQIVQPWGRRHGVGKAGGARNQRNPWGRRGKRIPWSLRAGGHLTRHCAAGGTGGGGAANRARRVSGATEHTEPVETSGARRAGGAGGACGVFGPMETAAPAEPAEIADGVCGIVELVEPAGGVCRRAMPVDGGCRSSRNLRCGGSGVAGGTAGRRCVSVGIMSCVTRWRRSGGAG